jgi:hypothetical protein
VIAPENLTVPLLQELGAQAYELYTAAHGALALDAEAARQVCVAGARIAQLLGITRGLAETDLASEPLVDFDAGETMDLPAGAAEGED